MSTNHGSTTSGPHPSVAEWKQIVALANDVAGFIAGMLTFTPYYHWRWEHSLHHATTGDLDRRGAGDVWTMTVQECLESSRWKRFAYRLARNPVVLFVLAPLFLFVARQRFPSAKASSRVPNNNLERCHQSHPVFQDVEPLTLLPSFGATRFRLWDERLRRLVSFRHAKDLRRRAKGAGRRHSIVADMKPCRLAGALCLWPLLAAAEPGPDPVYDPLEGMEVDGRIPVIAKPADLPNPERWRYIPEGRLKPGNVFQRFLVSSVIAPFVFHDDDVGTGFGVTAVDIDFREQRRRELAGVFLSYTTEGQQNYAFFWRRWLHHIEVPTGGVLQEERSFLRAAGGYTRTLTRRFFGLGPGTDESDETSYRDEEVFIELGVEHALPDPGDPLVVGGGLRGEVHHLGPGHVSGEPDTKEAFPGLFDDADPSELGWVEGEVRWDTRDSRSNPYRGWHVGAEVDAALLQDHGDVGVLWGVSGSRIFGLPPLFHDGGDSGEEHPPTDVLALGLQGRLASGNLPFIALPSLGGAETERGFIAGRFRDRAAWVTGAEYRFWFLPRGFGVPFTDAIRIERVGAALFYEVGAVARNESRIFESRVRQSGGVGLRVSLERAAPFRVDVGFSEDGVNVAARFGLPF